MSKLMKSCRLINVSLKSSFTRNCPKLELNVRYNLAPMPSQCLWRGGMEAHSAEELPYGRLPGLSDQGLASCHTTRLTGRSAKVGAWCSVCTVDMHPVKAGREMSWGRKGRGVGCQV